ncbi:DUF3043 domain-containing protein [Auraticoccus sp. F435]|uniref:DUF3043 domain-containing protein n=1 Tax=Auraticoccus cholistanensis TaxID=2656650 RepID=A0A6A9UZC0_9ACTN|nr:DUF3043 domain-containing protein [Auraticoccus cholistanensis]
MALFRPYKHEGTQRAEQEPTQQAAGGSEPGRTPPRSRAGRSGSSPLDVPADAPTQPEGEQPAGRVRTTPKARPTPSRREAEAARRERLNPSISKKEARRRAAEANRRTRMELMAARDSTPAKVLLRDHIDARFSLGQLLLPALLLIVLSTFLQAFLPQMVLASTVAMYVFLALVIGDFVLMWRGFRRIAEERRIPLEKGLKMYGMNRIIQIRRMRLPKPRVRRGDSY